MYEVLTPNGFSSFDDISREKKDVYKVITEDDFIKVTKGHKFETPNGFKQLKHLKINDLIKYKNKFSKIVSIDYIGVEYVYDLINVHKNNEYYTNNFVSHNCAFIDKWSEFSNSVIPTISASKKSQIIAASTPVGLNHWYKMWSDAVEGKSSYKPFKVEWWKVPGRDENYKELMIKTLEGGIRTWNQEYACEFIGSSDTLVDMTVLSNIKFGNTLREPNFGETIRVYEAPQENHKYMVLADAAKGAIDGFVFHVIDVTNIPFKQVASGKIPESYLMAPPIFYNVLRTYNEAVFVCENNEGAGTSVVDLLFQMYEYENIYQEPDKKWLGVRTTKSNRSKNLSNMKLFIENNKLILQDEPTVKELLTFCNINGKYQAQNSKAHDDYVMALSLLFVPLLDLNNIVDYDVFLNKINSDSETTDGDVKYLQMGFFDDGTSSFYGIFDD
ncbi:terminase subunit [Campylobacter phage vB_Cj_QDYZ]|uniref:Terminase subunit n=1 Tax=Campylobacter phage vB_Cj_QDYZ TaxID=3032374 RepID=A0AAF0JYR4_9CAUD|nr:terminase subunit [Campylobacter phage vB_Cj_QDYZ]